MDRSAQPIAVPPAVPSLERTTMFLAQLVRNRRKRHLKHCPRERAALPQTAAGSPFWATLAVFLVLALIAARPARAQDANGNNAAAEESAPEKQPDVFAATRVTLSGRGLPLDEVLATIEQQTGNRLIDSREQFGQQAAPRTLSLDLKGEAFWPAVDAILDQAALGPYAFSSEEGLSLVELAPGATARRSRGSYEGPFRIEVTELGAQRNLVVPDENRLRISLDVAWEPRLKPIVVSQAASDIEVVAEDDQPVASSAPEEVYEATVQAGSYSTQVNLPFALPNRNVKRLKSLSGSLTVFAPTNQHEFKFDNLQAARGVEQTAGGVTIELNRVVENNGIWEIHMRFRLDSDDEALQSHRDWVFQNITVLEDAQGAEIDHAGFETTMRSEDELGFAYLFEISGDIADYTWVYRTPVDIQSKTIKYRIKNLPLP